jgi:hypothetical protein
MRNADFRLVTSVRDWKVPKAQAGAMPSRSRLGLTWALDQSIAARDHACLGPFQDKVARRAEVDAQSLHDAELILLATPSPAACRMRGGSSSRQLKPERSVRSERSGKPARSVTRQPAGGQPGTAGRQSGADDTNNDQTGNYSHSAAPRATTAGASGGRIHRLHDADWIGHPGTRKST